MTFGKDINLIISDNSLKNDIKNLYKNEYINNKNIKYFSSKEYNCLDSNVNRSIELADENMHGYLAMMIF